MNLSLRPLISAVKHPCSCDTLFNNGKLARREIMIVKISVLGGGNEVGASCLHIEMANTALLIDAGMRMHGDDALPALGMLENLEAPEAILVTHAHADHIGALPIVHALYPNAPIYTTPPTVDLMKIMMKDSYKILEQRSRQTQELLPYTEEQVRDLINNLLYIPASGELKIGSLKITSFQAGHILGAVMFLIEGDGEKLLVTGDLSFKAGRTIHGAKVPQNIELDVVIMESTYGNRAHTDRNTEEKRLAEHVAEVVANGGFALVPAFALGRAQEVLLVLQDYMDKGLIPEFPIYVDGLVTPISQIYKNYPQYLKGNLAYKIRNFGDVFLREGRCKAVQPKEREQILQGKPGCIVASSGMLTGGASAWYAEKLITNPQNAIFITGYQDEESPGRKLLNVANGTENQLELNGRIYPVQCRIGKYGLSAHADANEMDRFIQTLKPTHTLLVHGDDDARSELAQKLNPRYQPLLVENGETYQFNRRKSGKGIVGKRYDLTTEQKALSEKVGSLLLYESEQGSYKVALCTGIHPKTAILFCQTLKGKTLKLQATQVVESIEKWNQSVEGLKEQSEQILTFCRPYLLNISWDKLEGQTLLLTNVFQILGLHTFAEKLAVTLALQALPKENKLRLPDGNQHYQFSEQVVTKLNKLQFPIQGLKMNSAQALDIVRSELANHPRFIRCGTDCIGTSNEHITMYFDFPDAVTTTEKSELAEKLQQITGWKIGFSESVRQDLLQSELMKLLKQDIESLSIHLQERKVIVPLQTIDNMSELQTQFKKQTGFDLQFNKDHTASTKQELFKVHGSGKKMENNQAIEEAKKWARERNITIYKTGFKQLNGENVMEVHFISPQIALKHETDLEELSYRIGMPVTYAQQPKQNEIIKRTLLAIPETWTMKKNPSIHIDKGLVAIKLTEIPEEEDVEQVNNRLIEETGYSLTITV
jgi:Cft2 family RNA processing exonuclease